MVEAIREATTVFIIEGFLRGEATMAQYAIIAYNHINAD
jgi:hypothetical protein